MNEIFARYLRYIVKKLSGNISCRLSRRAKILKKSFTAPVTFCATFFFHRSAVHWYANSLCNKKNFIQQKLIEIFRVAAETIDRLFALLSHFHVSIPSPRNSFTFIQMLPYKRIFNCWLCSYICDGFFCLPPTRVEHISVSISKSLRLVVVIHCDRQHWVGDFSSLPFSLVSISFSGWCFFKRQANKTFSFFFLSGGDAIVNCRRIYSCMTFSRVWQIPFASSLDSSAELVNIRK